MAFAPRPSRIQAVTIQAHYFVKNVWPHTQRTDEPDRGFQRAFADYMTRGNLFESGSAFCQHDFGRGLETLSTVQHELDFIGWTENNVCVFELKLYEVTALPKDLILAFYHKVLDFYLKNIEYFKSQRVLLFLPTRYAPIDDVIRMICFSCGIVLIDTELYPSRLIEYYASDMLAHLDSLTSENHRRRFENFLDLSRKFVQASSFSISDYFTLDSKNHIVFTPIIKSPKSLVRRHRVINARFGHLKDLFQSLRQN